MTNELIEKKWGNMYQFIFNATTIATTTIVRIATAEVDTAENEVANRFRRSSATNDINSSVAGFISITVRLPVSSSISTRLKSVVRSGSVRMRNSNGPSNSTLRSDRF